MEDVKGGEGTLEQGGERAASERDLHCQVGLLAAAAREEGASNDHQNRAHEAAKYVKGYDSTREKKGRRRPGCAAVIRICGRE